MTGSTARPEELAGDEHALAVRSRLDGAVLVVELSGELDLASGPLVIDACASVPHRRVIADLAGLTFMDCGGYRALLVANTILESNGGSLAVTNAVGEPRRLLGIMDGLEKGQLLPVVDGTGHPSNGARPRS